ncbi:hypothetical protein [Pseudomonas sp.]|uniref:hypothetical protein n=1 Tax=Pseudomonas sp. TaxID=306 RepID=UPI003D6EC882
MTKRERLDIENLARLAFSKSISCNAISKKLAVGVNGPVHEFDIYAEDVVIGGVSTSTYNTSHGNPNTGSRDRACAELLWLSLWPGRESRVHVLTDKPLADWLFKRFNNAPFPTTIDIYHYEMARDSVALVGSVGAGPST